MLPLYFGRLTLTTGNLNLSDINRTPPLHHTPRTRKLVHKIPSLSLTYPHSFLLEKLAIQNYTERSECLAMLGAVQMQIEQCWLYGLLP